MNGCYRSIAEVRDGLCSCPHYDMAHGRCLSNEEVVSRYDGFPICPKNPTAIPRTEWDRKVAELEAEAKRAGK